MLNKLKKLTGEENNFELQKNNRNWQIVKVSLPWAVYYCYADPDPDPGLNFFHLDPDPIPGGWDTDKTKIKFNRKWYP